MRKSTNRLIAPRIKDCSEARAKKRTKRFSPGFFLRVPILCLYAVKIRAKKPDLSFSYAFVQSLSRNENITLSENNLFLLPEARLPTAPSVFKADHRPFRALWTDTQISIALYNIIAGISTLISEISFFCTFPHTVCTPWQKSRRKTAGTGENNCNKSQKVQFGSLTAALKDDIIVWIILCISFPPGPGPEGYHTKEKGTSAA